MNDLILQGVIQLVLDERRRQDLKWGEQNHDNYRWLAILSEELGEVSQAILHDEFGGDHAGTVVTELIQLVAVGVQWLECINRQSVNRLLDVQRLASIGADRATQLDALLKSNKTITHALLQRKLKIGYPRAAAIIDDLVDLGWIRKEATGGFEVLFSN